MPGRIGDDELAFLCREKAVSDIDRDALLTLRRKAINQKCKVYLFALGAVFRAIALKCRQLVFEDHLRIVKQAPDKRAFAIVNRTARDETQHFLVLLRIKIGGNVFRDQSFRSVHF